MDLTRRDALWCCGLGGLAKNLDPNHDVVVPGNVGIAVYDPSKLVEIGVENERIIQGAFLVEFEGPLKKYLNNKYVISFVRPPNMDEEKAFSFMIEHESPEAEKSWDNLKSSMCRNCK